MIACAARLEVLAVPGVPLVGPGADLPAILTHALSSSGIRLADGDVLVVSSKLLSRAEGRFVELPTVVPSPRALDLATRVGKDARLVELILRESSAVSRATRGVLVVRHRLGFIAANAGIDASNAVPPGSAADSGPWALLLPDAPDASAAAIRARLEVEFHTRIGVVVSDSFGRPFRLGTVGAAIGVSGLPPLWDRRGEPDLFGRLLEQTVTALGDQVAAAADLVAGQAAEGRPLVLVRGLTFDPSEQGAQSLTRSPEEDLYA
ncbi:MAG TPA: coenzyme F420-0:L-glutamate ligase [Polyangiaceae bacterium]|jgi:coenzyme F420-0:L-glutamate ligase/coenzyme F420-1:gamma-L-glutamate ligase|nr:coenzyme F420-0:L-glutamate ligase [Polyangiaceae bacterium]